MPTLTSPTTRFEFGAYTGTFARTDLPRVPSSRSTTSWPARASGVLSIAIPVGFIAVADHYRQSTGIDWLGALGALVALALVLAVGVVASRR